MQKLISMSNYSYSSTQMFNISDQYDREMYRQLISQTVIYYLIKYFKLKNILELGFYEGQTFGLMLEATEPGASLTAIDIHYRMDLYNQYYKDSIYTKDKQIELLEMSSHDFVPVKKYDFINVDGDHTYSGCCDDLEMAVTAIDQNGILMLDNYSSPQIDMAVINFLDKEHDFVPFLIDHQAVFFHHASHDAQDFLDVELNKFSHICALDNIGYKDFEIKSVLPKSEVNVKCFMSQPEIFHLGCKYLKI